MYLPLVEYRVIICQMNVFTYVQLSVIVYSLMYSTFNLQYVHFSYYNHVTPQKFIFPLLDSNLQVISLQQQCRNHGISLQTIYLITFNLFYQSIHYDFLTLSYFYLQPIMSRTSPKNAIHVASMWEQGQGRIPNLGPRSIGIFNTMYKIHLNSFQFYYI